MTSEEGVVMIMGQPLGQEVSPKLQNADV
jgi:hypothetical protein